MSLFAALLAVPACGHGDAATATSSPVDAALHIEPDLRGQHVADQVRRAIRGKLDVGRWIAQRRGEPPLEIAASTAADDRPVNRDHRRQIARRQISQFHG